MTRMMKRTGCAKSMPAGLAIGAGSAMGITLLGCGLSAKLVDMELMEQGKIGYAIMIVLMAASFASAIVSCKKIRRRKALVCACSGAVYMLLLLIMTALFFGADYEAVWETMAVISAGSMLALISENGRSKRVGKKKIKLTNC